MGGERERKRQEAVGKYAAAGSRDRTLAMLRPLLLSRTESKAVKKDAANRRQWQQAAEAN